MKKPDLLLQLIDHLARKKAALNHSSYKSDAGYTLIELLVVVIILGILATIAAPSWLGFVSQRRVNAANELVLRSLQEAQSMAKNKKLSYSVSVGDNDNNGVPEIAVYQGNTPPNNGPEWKSFENELGIKPGQVLLGTNLATDANKVSSFTWGNLTDKKITFDYLGALPPDTTWDDDQPLTIAVAAGKGNSPNQATMRCVQVKTLLGALKTGKGQAECISP